MRHTKGRLVSAAAGALFCAGLAVHSIAGTTNAFVLAFAQGPGAGRQPGPEPRARPPEGTYGQKFHKRDRVLIDDFEGGETDNLLGGKANIFVQSPSRVMVSRDRVLQGSSRSWSVVLNYDRRKEGGPYNCGGWCGYYTLLKRMRGGAEDTYFDASPFNYITFSVRGENGDESFVVGLADRHWDKVGDSLKSLAVGKYLKAGRITKDWQEARIPLDVFFLDRSKLSAVSIGFEASCFPDGSGTGTVYIDDLALEK